MPSNGSIWRRRNREEEHSACADVWMRRAERGPRRPEQLTYEELKRAADAGEISVEEPGHNIQNTLATGDEGGDGDVRDIRRRVVLRATWRSRRREAVTPVWLPVERVTTPG